MFDFSRMSLIQQHEGVSIMLLSAVEKRHVEARDFEDLLKLLQRLDRYDSLLGKLSRSAAISSLFPEDTCLL